MNLVPRLPAHAESTIAKFLRAHVRDAHAEGVVLGLSGGIDSALCARLCADALGPTAVLAVAFPDATFPAELLAEGEAYARGLGIQYRAVPIDPVEAAVHQLLPEITDRTTLGNVKARARMMLAYSLARERHRLVVGTGNKSELLLGYFTKFGDGGADLLPIGDLYKTQLRELSVSLGLPQVVLDRPPTAGLWEGQTDEGELGLPYAVLDQILFGIEQLVPPAEIAAALGLPAELITGVEHRVLAHRHKRRSPPIPKLGLRTVGLDWRD